MSPADMASCAGKLALRRQAAFAAKEPPRLHQRADGDVERAAGLAVITYRLRDEVEQLLRNRDGMPIGFAVDPRQRAVRLVVTHEAVDAVDLIERLVEDARQRLRVAAVRLDGVLARHRDPAADIVVQRW